MSREASVAELVRAVLQGLPVGSKIEPSENLKKLLLHFEYDLPQLLREQGFYGGSDGMLATIAIKIAQCEAVFVGECILMTGQRVTPFHVRLQIAADSDEINWLEFRLGKRQGPELKTEAYGRPWPADELIAAADNVDAIDWYYAAGFGDK